MLAGRKLKVYVKGINVGSGDAFFGPHCLMESGANLKDA